MKAGLLLLVAAFVFLWLTPRTLVAEEFRCGTGAATDSRQHAVAQFAASRFREAIASEAAPALEGVDGIAVMAADDFLAPYYRPFDLAGSSLLFVPRGEQYVATRGPVSVDPNRGVELALSGTPAQTRFVLPFPFPLFGKSLTQVYVSRYNAIHGAEAISPQFWQYDALEAVTQRSPLISPLLVTASGQAGVPRVYVKSSAASCEFTWMLPDLYEVRATLFPDGRIQFSYVSLPTGTQGQVPAAVVVTSGAEPWRAALSAMADSGDIPGGVPQGAPSSFVPMLDVTLARVSRVAGLDLLRAEARVATPPDTSALGATGKLAYTLCFEGAGQLRCVYVELRSNGDLLMNLPRPIGGFQVLTRSAAVRLDGDVLSLDLLDEHLGFTPTRFSARSSLFKDSLAYSGDTVTVPFQYVPPQARVVTDLSALPPAGSVSPVILEAFTRPTVNLNGVWTRLKGATGWSNNDVDAVVVYENFATDTNFFASAYAHGGNPGVDGIGPFASASKPKAPTILQMTSAYFGPGMPDHQTVLLHEFGHRWLFSARYRDASGIRDDLNPDYAHPAQWVDTRAAFAVASNQDCSVMGGAVFTPKSDGSFAIADVSPYGYSWLDLYLMGLADQKEVPSFFYIANSQPPLGIAYSPSPSIKSVRGLRTDVSVDQVIAAVGPRKPAFPAAARAFSVAFVLVRDPSRPASANEIAGVQWARDTFLRDFPVATGGRGEARVLRTEIRGRRRSVRH